MFPLAAGVSLCVGAFWWSLTLRHEGAGSVTLQDNGQEWVIGADAQPILPAVWPQELRAAITQAVRTGRLIIPADLAALRDTPETFASRRSARPNIFRVRSPVATAIFESKPRFRWTPVKDATEYRLSLMTKESGKPGNETMLPARTTEWSPDDLLKSGVTYGWRVQAMRGDSIVARAPEQPDAFAWFRILSEPERAAWEREQSAVGDSNFLRGIVAARAGLLEEAAEEFRALGRQNPRAEPARLFLEQVESVGAR
ncbi:MAG: hypothetical protein ABI946_04925 [Chthoniobacterales bacterium]